MNTPYKTLITGGNSEIAIEVCRQSIREGNKVIALYNNNHARLDELASEVGDKLQVMQVDFSKPSSVEEFITNNKEVLNSIDVFVSLAALRRNVRYGNIGSEDLLQHYMVNVIPSVLLIQYLGSAMAKKGWGRIVMGSSIGVKFGGGNETYCYSLTKYASELIPKIAKNWLENGVLTNVVRIGVTNTEALKLSGAEKVASRKKLIPIKRLAEPKEIANTIYWLASSNNSYISGQIISVSGGE